MNILFYCPFNFNINSSNLRSLGGIESLNIELSKFLSKSHHKIFLATYCKKMIKKKNIINIPIDFLLENKSSFAFDKIISSNDPTIFNHFKYSKNFLWLHNKLPIEKAIRKKKFLPIITNEISAIFVSDYLSKKTSNIYNFKKKIIIPNFLDPIFYKTKPHINRKPYFIWSVQRKKGLEEIINIWTQKVYKINPNTKLYIFGIDKFFFNKRETKTLLNHNIFLKGRVSKNELKKYYNKSMGMICLGYDETFCINAIEAFSCGLPLITFGLTAVNELIDNKNSFKINNFNELDEKILEILDMNKLQRKRYINYCYIFSKRYQIKKIIPLWKRVFNS
ncbi:glycosyltransferase [Candidatus Pelagibacter sp.]|nr:glycosyltransferase [Candidatus Pelagibacter sp.]